MTPVLGATLHVGDVIVDPVDGVSVHEITDFTEYPGRTSGDHMRRAHGDGWHATVADGHTYQLDHRAMPAAA